MSQGVEGASGARQGQADYVLYQLAAQQQKAGTACNASGASLPNSACVFYDVTVGNNSVPGEPAYPTGAYSSTAGYDLASGLGSVNITNLVNAWNTVSFPATTTTLTLNGGTTAITVAHGTQVTVGIGVTASSGTPTGDVSLIAATGLNGQTVVPLSQPSGSPIFKLTSGSLSAVTAFLPGSGSTTPYLVTAHYAGDGTFAPSDSSPGIQVNVTPETSTTTLTLLANDPSNGNPLTSPFPFGSIVFVRADVVSATNSAAFCQSPSFRGCPTGAVKFTDTFGALPTMNPQVTPPVAVSSTPALNSKGNTSIGDGIISFDAGNHVISAQYQGDASFSASNSAAPVSFTI